MYSAKRKALAGLTEASLAYDLAKELYERELIRTYGKKHANQARYLEHHVSSACDMALKQLKSAFEAYNDALKKFREVQTRRVLGALAGIMV